MNTNSQEIVQQIRTQFDTLLALVLDTANESYSADQMERALLTELRKLGCALLLAFITARQAQIKDIPAVEINGETLARHSQRKRSLRTVFGKIVFVRNYYYREGNGYALLDARLNLPAHRLSDVLHEWMLQLACYTPYHKTGRLLENLVAQKPSTREIEQAVQHDSTLVEAFYAQTSAPAPQSEADVLVAQADGKGIPMCACVPAEKKVRLSKGEKNSRKKEAIVTAVYTIAPCVRTPQQVVEALFQTTPRVKGAAVSRREGPQNKQLWATLNGKRAAVAFAAAQVARREGDHIQARVALSDGSAPLQQRLREHLPDFPLILDLIHATEYLWEVANALHGETSPHRNGWAQARLLVMLEGKTQQLIDEWEEMAVRPTCTKTLKTTIEDTVRYYRRNLDCMRYDAYLKAGWPIATGVIEGACRHLVKDRFELAGMRWSLPGANALLAVRCVAENEDWHDFQVFRQKQRQTQQYGSPAHPAGTSIERAAVQPRTAITERKAA